jgi:hypothetical protein
VGVGRITKMNGLFLTLEGRWRQNETEAERGASSAM